MILTFSILSHLVIAQVKPRNLIRPMSTTQTVERPARIKQEALQDVFKRQA
jgi:hypothetical protein